MRIALFSILLLSLTACRAVWDPTFMPAGYTYHGDDAYNAPDGPEADDIGYQYSHAKNREILEIWSITARDMVDQLEAQTGMGPQPVYVETLPETSAFNSSYEHVLREELVGRGYELVGFEGSNLHLRYEAFLPADEQLRQGIRYNDDPGIVQLPENRDAYSTFILTLTAMRDGIFLGEVRSMYDMPAYGYESGTGRHDTDEMIRESRE